MFRHQFIRPSRSALGALIACVALVMPLIAGAPAGALDRNGQTTSNTHRHLIISDVTATRQEVAAASAAVAPGDPLGAWEQALLTDFPDTYGGLYVDSSGTFVIPTVGSAPALRSWARANLPAAISQYIGNGLGGAVGGGGALVGRRTAAASLGSTPGGGTPELSFTEASSSLESLLALKADILANTTLVADGVIGAGIDVENDAVSVTTTGGDVDAVLESDYGSQVEVSDSSGTSLDASRTADSAPYNGGDMLGSPSGTACTLGFGLHDTATGQTYSLTAGHCGNATWYNVPENGGTLDSGDLVGSTVSGSKYTSGIDAQLIDDSSSCISWGSSGTRLYVTGYANPPEGATIWSEGAVTGQQTGVVTTYDWSGKIGGESLTNIDLTTAVTQPGDSGGPLVYPTGFGALAGGTVVGVVITSNGTDYGAVELIDAELYDYSAFLGDTVTPNVSSNGSSC